MKLFNSYGKWYLKSLTLMVFIGVGLLGFYIVGCQDLDFSAIPEYNCEEEINVEGVSCEEPEIEANMYEGESTDGEADGEGGSDGEGREPRDPRVRTGKPPIQYGSRTTIQTVIGKIDILFVVDNSGSMKEELASIANQFDSFLNSIRDMDYRIAMITTDWLNDRGRLLQFPNGRTFLGNPNRISSVHNENVAHFQKTVKRPVGNTDDERGIYALNMALDNSSNADFFRPHTIFVVIIVSDEDERSYGGYAPPGQHGNVPPLESYDLPETFFRKFSHQNKYSTLYVHSIIIKPGDTSCVGKAGGLEGRIYAQASNPSSAILAKYGNIRKGHVGSICSSNYSSQLGPIGDLHLNEVILPLPCFPASNSVSLKVDGKSVGFRVVDRQIVVNERVSFGAQAKYSFYCKKNN